MARVSSMAREGVQECGIEGREVREIMAYETRRGDAIRHQLRQLDLECDALSVPLTRLLTRQTSFT